MYKIDEKHEVTLGFDTTEELQNFLNGEPGNQVKAKILNITDYKVLESEDQNE